MAPTDAEIIAAGPWFQRIIFPSGLVVGSWHTEGMYSKLCSGIDLDGMSALDIGCMAGVGSLWMERNGARVVGCDIEDRHERQFWMVMRAFGAKADFERLSVYDIGKHDASDVVVMGGLYYHLEHPLLGLSRAWNATREVLCVEGETMPGDAITAQFVPGQYRGDGSNWWIPTKACLRAWLEWLDGPKTVVDVTREDAHPGRVMFQVWRGKDT